MSEFIQNYQFTDKGLLCQFENFEVVKGTDVVEVPSWDVRNFLSFKSIQVSPNAFEQRGLDQNNKNIMNSIFCNFYLMMWWEYNSIEGYYAYPFEEVTYHSKYLLSCQVRYLN